MNKLIIINGTPGAGKSTIAKALNHRLNQSIWIDGDWCWMMDPFEVNDENKAMVESNINHFLNNAIKNSNFKHIIFNWVISSDDLMNKIIKGLTAQNTQIHKITLMCDDEVLRRRLRQDNRTKERIENSINRQKTYLEMDTIKINTSYLSIDDIIERIEAIIEE